MASRIRRLVSAVLVVAGMLAGASAASAASSKHFLWKVTGGKGTAYLLGTIHIGEVGFYPLPAIIEDSFKRSDTLVEEIDLSAGDTARQISQTIILQGTYPTGDSILNHLSEATRTRLADYAKTSGLGPNYTRLKPWLLGLLIDVLEAKRLGLDESRGLDRHFAQEAVQLHKPIDGLETADFQLKMVMSFSDPLQDKMLLSTLLEAAKGPEMLNHILRAWTSGDLQDMEDVITQAVREYPYLQPAMDAMIYARNDTMAGKIARLLENQKVYFVAVGAAHLVGARGILEQLRDKGYTIEQL